MAKGCLLCCYDATLVVAVFWWIAAIVVFGFGISAYAFYQVVVAFWVFMLIAIGLAILGYLMSRRRMIWKDNSKRAKGWRKLTEPPVIQYIYIILAGTIMLVFIASIIWITQSEHQSLMNLKLVNRGQLSHNSATFLIRNSQRTEVYMQYRTVGSSTWQQTEVFDLFEVRDFSTGITLADLTADTDYEYQAVFDNGDEISDIELMKTRPIPGPNSNYSFKFGFGSCIYKQNGPLLNVRRMAQEEPDFNVFLGDTIYWEHPFPLSTRTPFYHYKYRAVYSDEDMQNLLKYPSYFMIDDHEIDNDWDFGVNDRYIEAIRGWNDYCGVKNPKINATAPEHALYYNFDIGSTSFFIVDTRTFRSSNSEPANSPTKRMLGPDQMQDLLDWLIAKNSSQVKFIGTSVPFTELARGAEMWIGRTVERQRILDFVEQNHIKGIVFLSGDRHWAGAFKIRDGIYEYSVSPIDGFYANGFGPRQLAENREELLWYGDGDNFYGMIEVNPEDDIILRTSITAQNGDPVEFNLRKADLGITN